jgi:transposase
MKGELAMDKDNKISFKGQHIYTGIDVGKKAWSVTILTEQFEHKTFTQPPVPETLVKYLKRNFPQADYSCAYEAGLSGFWICDALNQLGVDCIVVHPADIPTKDKERRNRNDNVDSRKIARNLRNGELTPIYILSRQAQEDRSLVRMRMLMVKKQTRCKNQIKSLLTLYGINIPNELTNSDWSIKFIDWLDNLQFQYHSGKQSLTALLSELKHFRQAITQLTAEIRNLSRQEPYVKLVDCLVTIPGVSVITAMVLLTEIVDINRFKSLDQFASYVGLIPGEDSSGDKEIHTGLSYRRNAYLRVLLIESSWVAVRKDPSLLMTYNKLIKQMPKNRAIVKIARKLLNRIRYVLKNQQPYEPCVVS